MASSAVATRAEKENKGLAGNKNKDACGGNVAKRKKKKLYYRFGDVKDGQVCAPTIVRRVLEEEGWREAEAASSSGAGQETWHLFWKSGRFTVGEYDRSRASDQRLNHFAKSSQICTKDSLVRIMRRNKATHGKVFDFIPETYLLPNEYNKFLKSYGEQREKETLWICKPTDLSRGQKIFVMKVSDAPRFCAKQKTHEAVRTRLGSDTDPAHFRLLVDWLID